jgi:hypothetical protein
MTNQKCASVFAAIAISISVASAQPVRPILSPVAVGAREITGSANSGAGVTVTATVTTPSGPVTLTPVNTDLATGRFTISLPANLQIVNGTVVSVIQTVSGQNSASVSVTATEPLYDWGRVRAYFSGGMMISKEREDFSKNDFYLGLQVDKNWLQWKKFLYFNSFFDTILAAVPVQPGAGDNSGGSTGGTGGSGTGGGNGGGSGGSSGSTTTTDPLDRFLPSRKAAILRIGAYLPLVVQKWDFDNAKHGLFIGPLAKAGIETITNNRVSVNGSATSPQFIELDDLYNFHAYGIRIGHFKLNSGRNTSPELISNLDLAFGRFENFERCRMGGNRNSEELVSCLDPSVPPTQQFRVRPWRYSFEGRLKVPGSQVPLYVGFNANGGKGRDDLRFVFGTMFDIGNLYRKIKPSLP